MLLMIAYSEFKFYILKYLIYAKENYPSIYKDIIKNKNFMTAFNKIDKKYLRLNETFDKNLIDIANLFSVNGYKAQYNGKDFEVYESNDSGGYSITNYHLQKGMYDKLMQEMEKSEYQNIIK